MPDNRESLTVQIKEGYYGFCSDCDADNAKHKVYMPFTHPVVTVSDPPIEGVYVYVCDECYENRTSNV